MSAPAVTVRGEEFTLGRITNLVLNTKLVWRGHPDLEDIVQEVMVKIWQNPGMAPPVIARSTTIDYLRKHGTLTRRGVQKATENTLSLDALVRNSEEIRVVDTIASDETPIDEIDFESDAGKKLLAMLSPHEHYTVLSVANGVPMNTISRDLSVTISRVSQHLDSARQRWLGQKPPYARRPLRERSQEASEKSDSPQRKRREIQVLQWLADGVPVGSMPGKLGIGRNHLNRIMAGAVRRMGAHTKPQAVAEAMRRGLIK